MSRDAPPLVSIVTPCLNAATTLEACIASVQSQSYPSIEHIVVDGASDDGTVDLLRHHAETLRWVSERDAGQAAAINKGFDLARGDILGWLNADDALDPLAIERVVRRLLADPDAGWVYGDCEFLTETGMVEGKAPPRLDLHLVIDSCPVFQPGTFTTRWAFDRVGPLDESLDLVFDYDLWVGLLEAGIRPVYEPSVLARIALNAGTKTGRSDRGTFKREGAAVLLKRGFPREAAPQLGVAAAWAALVDGRVERARLDEEIRTAQAIDEHVPKRLVRAAALSEAALISGGRWSRLGFLLSPAIWAEGRTRREVAERYRRRLPI